MKDTSCITSLNIETNLQIHNQIMLKVNYLLDLAVKRGEKSLSLFILPLKACQNQRKKWLLTQQRHTANKI